MFKTIFKYSNFSFKSKFYYKKYVAEFKNILVWTKYAYYKLYLWILYILKIIDDLG